MVTKQIGEVREPVTHVELDHAISAGITWGALGPDMVPIFEEHATRMENKYTLEAWYALPAMERALAVALRRIDMASKNLQSEAELRDAKRNAKKK